MVIKHTLLVMDVKAALKIPGIDSAEIFSINTEARTFAMPVKILAPEFEHGGVYPVELVVINQIVAHCAPGRIFEIGTFNGRTTLNMAANSGEKCVIHTLDLPEGLQPGRCLRPHPVDEKYVSLREVGSHFLKTFYNKKIHQLFGDSAVFDFSPYAGTIDMVFIDGSHSYDYVMNDSVKALALLKKDQGLILWHDYGTVWPDVTRALNELYEKNPVFAGMRHVRGTSLVLLRRS